jgi:Putative zinc-finger
VPEFSHQSDGQLELYALGRLTEPELAVVEEHLLVCVSCQVRLDEVELFAVAMRQAISSETLAQSRVGLKEWLRAAWATPWSFAGAAAVLAAAVLATVLYLHSGRNVPPLASLDLAAMRGDVPQVGQARETDIRLTDTPIHNPAQLLLEVVDSDGRHVWTGQLGSNRRTVRIMKQLAPGSYFVRLFDQDGKLLHEYGFNVRIAPL